MLLKVKVRLRTAAVIALVGVVIIVLSQSHVVISRVAKLTLRNVEVPTENAVKNVRVFLWKYAHEAFSQGDGSGGLLEFSANVGMNVEHPRSSFTDDSFFVRISGLTLSVQRPSDLRDRGMTGSKVTNSPSDNFDWSQGTIRSLFDEGCLGLNLSVPGSEVSPKEFAPLRDGTAEWIVRPARAGRYQALIQIVETPCPDRSLAALRKQSEQEYSFEFTNQPSSFSFDVTDRLLTRERLLSWIGGFFGAFLTLPGVIAFFEAQRQKRRKRGEDDEKSSRIIV